ncbi:hypothetical protein ACVPOR_14945 [Staphylococcus aureus]
MKDAVYQFNKEVKEIESIKMLT